MSSFWKKDIARGPSFVLIETALPYEVSKDLLGSVVVDIRNPTHEYRPKSPSNLNFEKYFLETEDTNVSSFLSANKGHRLEGTLGNLFNISFTGREKTEEFFEGLTVRTRTMSQHRDIQEALLSSGHRDDILTLLRNNGGKGYMVVGIKTAVGGKRTQKEETLHENKLTAQLSVDQLTGISMPPGGIKPSVVVQGESGRQRQAASNMEGEQIFAVQYRTLRLRKPSARLDTPVAFGPVKRVKVEAGMFGNDGDRELVFEDSDEASDEEQDDSTVALSNDSFGDLQSGDAENLALLY
jgi:hypothetical protein